MRARIFSFLAALALSACGGSHGDYIQPSTPTAPNGFQWSPGAAGAIPMGVRDHAYPDTELRPMLTGAVGSPSFLVVGGTNLPPGIFLTQQGKLSGMPNASGSYRVSIQAKDAQRSEAVLTFNFVVLQ